MSLTDTPPTNMNSQSVHKELANLEFALNQHAIVSITDTNGIIQDVNDKFCLISGYSREELIGQNHRIINSGHHPQTIMRNLWLTITQGRVWRDEQCNRAKDGALYWVDTTIIPYLDQEGKPYRYMAISTDITARKEVETQLHALSRRFVSVQEQERRHLSRELHDEIGQYLTGLKLTLEAIPRLPADAAALRLSFAQGIVENLLERVRDLAIELRPVALDTLGLIPALGLLFSHYTSQTAVQVMFYQESLQDRYAPEIESCLYRIIQEALTNVARHAQTDKVSVYIWQIEKFLILYITDDGKGFDATKTSLSSCGLNGMRERVLALGGEIKIDSTPNKGTSISVNIEVS